MRLTTKFSAFFTLLTGLTIFVTLIGSSLSFYNGIQYKIANRVQAVATVLDNRLLNTPFDKLDNQLDEIMVPLDIVRIDFTIDGKTLFHHSRSSSYLPMGSHYQFREMDVPSIKHPGMMIHLVYQDPMANYFRSLMTTAPLTGTIVFMVLVVFIAVFYLLCWYLIQRGRGLRS